LRTIDPAFGGVPGNDCPPPIETARNVADTLAGWSWRVWNWNWWRGPHVDPLVARLARRASAGSIVVIHDGHHVNPRADRRHSIEIVKRPIPRLRDRGFAFGTLCDASATPAPR
jgi:peptidoglycan/xylan/chitin deacetylase (PgdA/CDA1 family)